MTISPVLPKLVGARVKRREDPRLIQGRATYVDDLKIPSMCHLAFKRSDVAHGRISSIDINAAKNINGVEAVYTGAQIAEFLKPMPNVMPWPAPPHHAVAIDVVRYVGEPVAVVVASDRYIARDAADAIVVDYEALPAVVDPERAITGQSICIHENFENNIAVPHFSTGTGVSRDGKVDDSAVDKAFGDADVVISQRMVNQRLAPTPIEPRGVVAHYEFGKETLTIWSSTPRATPNRWKRRSTPRYAASPAPIASHAAPLHPLPGPIYWWGQLRLYAQIRSRHHFYAVSRGTGALD